MQWIKSTDRLPTEGIDTVVKTKYPTINAVALGVSSLIKRGDKLYWENETTISELSENDEWLDESAPITEDMVKDLPFINVDHDENGEVTSAICNAITDRYDVTKYAKGWAVRIDSTLKYTACDDLAHGIALCNQHHKKIILSQLKP